LAQKSAEQPSLDATTYDAKSAKGACKIRGFSTNVSNYNSFNGTTPDTAYGPGPKNPNWNELKYIQALTVLLKQSNIPAQFIVDQGRSGQADLRPEGKYWCNVKGAGYGIPPTANTGVCGVDALVWVKPGGDSDGTSDKSSERYNESCASKYSKVPSPEAGVWFNDYAEMLVINANPPLKPFGGAGKPGYGDSGDQNAVSPTGKTPLTVDDSGDKDGGEGDLTLDDDGNPTKDENPTTPDDDGNPTKDKNPTTPAGNTPPVYDSKDKNPTTPGKHTTACVWF
jgi:hypothetical protein